ncbi:hypothetical protein GCM10010321_87350 [Streptomyces chartreusis]|nr:hypothetical protein [Streptomyces chartreusis]GGX56725.1 hypothetical protein GCM10010321_87350 [Streptomyces chartreusis]
MAMGDPQSRIPAYPGVDRFIEAFDRLVVQSRRTRSRVPVVLLHEPEGGDAGRRIVSGLRSRMRGRIEVLAPHAYIPQIPDGADPPPLELFELLTNQLKETMPPGTGELRLHSYRLLRSVVTAPAFDGLREHRHTELRNHCYAQHRAWSRTAQTLWWLGGRDQASGGTLLELLWNFVAGPLFQRLPRAVYGRRINRHMLGRARSRRWYARWVRQQQGSPPTDFFRSALDLVHIAQTLIERDGQGTAGEGIEFDRRCVPTHGPVLDSLQQPASNTTAMIGSSHHERIDPHARLSAVAIELSLRRPGRGMQPRGDVTDYLARRFCHQPTLLRTHRRGQYPLESRRHIT